MDRERWEKISRIFETAIDRAPGERERYVREVCGDDRLLSLEIAEMIRAHESDDDFLDSTRAALPLDTNLVARLTPGTTVGVFQIVSFIGAGGMGDVYLARDTQLDRPVALKFLSHADDDARARLIHEAKAAAALTHPQICTIHDIGTANGVSYIVMQHVEGKPLSALLNVRGLPLLTALDYGRQIARALVEAHRHGIAHRDIKPANIIVTPDGNIKILDFGIAEFVARSETAGVNASGNKIVPGTANYMSPELRRGMAVDYRADLWSLGVVLYEMIAGRKPSAGKNIYDGKLEFPPECVEKLQAIIEKALDPDIDRRYPTAEAMLADIENLREEIIFEEKLRTHAPTGRLRSLSAGEIKRSVRLRRPTSPVQIAAAVLILALTCAAALAFVRLMRRNAAHRELAQAAELARQEKDFEAYDLALDAERYLPDAPELAALMPIVSKNLTVTSEPAGAKVYLQRFQPDAAGNFPEPELIGETPITDLRVARGQYVVRVEKENFAAFERTISSAMPRIGGSFIESPPVALDVKLLPRDEVPDKMTPVSAGNFVSFNWSRLPERDIYLDGFFIDKYEVSNREYKEFVTAGGYLTKSYWKIPFVKNGREVPLPDAVKEFKDKTGLPAPRSWVNQNYPPNADNLPVTDITWYEAAAYAEFRGKELPTIYQWEKAARDGVHDVRYNAMPWGLIRQGEDTKFRANFAARGTVAVDAFPFGMSPYGVANMAGNVAEWCVNRSNGNYVTSGGGWNDLPYSFGDFGEYPGFFASDKIGFRCVKNISEQSRRGDEDLPPPVIPVYRASSEKDYRDWLKYYDYEKTPLDARTVETTETDSWRREKIEFTGAEGKTAIAYLYLPKNFATPLQVVQYLPAGDVAAGLRALPESVEMFLPSVIKSGRAVFTVVLEGYNERPYADDFVPPAETSPEFRRIAVNRMTDVRRGLDYLETRPDIDAGKMELLGISNGANLALLALGVEKRWHTAILVGLGVDERWRAWIPEANYINFAPHAELPKLVINGRYDEAHPFKSYLEPIYRIMSEPKKLVVYEGGHIPTSEFFANTVNARLDEINGAPREQNLER